MSIHVKVERPIARFGLAVWVWRTPNHPDDSTWILKPDTRVGEDRINFHWEEVLSNADYSDSPSMILDDEVVAALAVAFAEHEPPNTAMSNHLKDTINVRDRLLVLVEKLWEAR